MTQQQMVHLDLWKQVKLAQYKQAIVSGENPEGRKSALQMARFDERELARAEVQATMTDVHHAPDMARAEKAYSDGATCACGRNHDGDVDTDCIHYTPKPINP